MLTHFVVTAISDAIKHRRLLPGTKLNERELALLFGVSRTIVRQALIRLSQDGLVLIAPKRAATVAQPSFEEAFSLYQMLLIIDCGVVDQLIEKITPEQLDFLEAHTRREEDAFHEGKLEEADELGREFHRLLIAFLNNDILSQIHAQLERKAALITSLYKVDFQYCHLRHEHVDLIGALRNKQAERVKSMLGSHYNLVIRGYRFDVAAAPEVDLAAALQLPA
jgi:DNA-binding GntR family transcriptional regulator